MEKFELITPCHFGLEAVMKREIQDLGYEISSVEDGKVTFTGDAEAVAYANVFLRTTERVLIQIGKAKAETWDELFEAVKSMPWERYIPKNGKFWVAKANSIKSKLFSPSDIQSIIKKAIVERLKKVYHVEWFPEDGESYPIRVSFLKDVVTIGLDTSGVSLHKRGYRQMTAKAPITETLAAALLMLTPWKGDRILVDPFCGSGTFPIEAAMMAADMAPGMNRSFLAEEWSHLIPRKCWYDAMDDARDRVRKDVETDIQGFDIDGDVIKASRENAKLAGVDHLIHFQQRPVSELSHPKKYGFIITNPPYGERLEDKANLPELYRALGERYQALDSWSMYLITSFEDAQKYMGRKADKNRKIYNGMLKTYFYQYQGPKPPRRTEKNPRVEK
ncbi:MAG TPA: class I SAM-dependent RNA methyltransferase [Candidatus Pelethocola excrementipullorum]|nr:class I SAM-dependent RNA methyltransferase [Candidatus Pelethocola excrementipullorum]